MSRKSLINALNSIIKYGGYFDDSRINVFFNNNPIKSGCNALMNLIVIFELN